LSNWKKIVVSGSQAHLASVTASKFLADSITFTTTSGISVGVGELAWNNSDGTLDLGMKGGNVVQQIGQEIFYEVRNDTGDVIENGTAVYESGVTVGSGRIIASPFTADGSVREVRFLGLATEDINNGVNGFVTNFGYVRGLDTRGTEETAISVGDEDWQVGDVLYAHPTVAGKLTNIPPKHKIYVAILIVRHQNVGVLFVKPSSYGHIDDIHDVSISTGSLSSGDLLVYDASSDDWKNSKQLTGSYGLTGSLQATSFTGSLQGTATTASYILNAVSSSFATTASYVLGGGGGGASVTNPGNNFVITSDGTSGGLVGETNLTFDGSTLNVTGSVIAQRFTGSLQYFDFNANTNTSNGIGIGVQSTGNNNGGVGVGVNAKNNYDYGVGVGIGAYDNYLAGVGVGQDARTNYSSGVGVGNNARNNYSGGVGIGSLAYDNYTYGVGVGFASLSNNNYAVGIGAYTNGNLKGTGTVTIGAYSTAQRQNEFVTTATNGGTNKAQSIIQKFRNVSLASSGGIWQEIFTDASSARLTILASSVYHYRIQINAIGATGFLCKTWEITGAIKRDASNNTTMVGGAPTYLITSEDTSTGNWDVRVTADNTNEALEIEVKHDYANNVTFSATVWATETRL
jgi:hypothetical protein